MPSRCRPASRALVAGVLLLLALTLASCGGGESEIGEAESRAPVLLAAGDIAECDAQGDEATAQILERHPEATVAPLGDLAYPQGTARDFAECFDPSWGRFRDRMRPAVGNHDHATEDARPYAEYFGERAGPFDLYRYAYDLGSWRVLVLDSDCWRVGGCDADDPQARWFRDELRRNPRRCTLAYWHRPPYSSGRYGDDKDADRVRPLWRIAVEEGVDVVLAGHEHSYERHVPMDPDGRADPAGTTLFVVGTGGGNLREYRNPPLETTAARNADTHGVLRLDLREDGYDWRFLPVDGGTFEDQGSADCR